MIKVLLQMTGQLLFRMSWEEKLVERDPPRLEMVLTLTKSMRPLRWRLLI